MQDIVFQWMLLLASSPFFLFVVSTASEETSTSEWLCRIVRNNLMKEVEEINIFVSSNEGVVNVEDEDGDWECIVSWYDNGEIASGHQSYVLQNLPDHFVSQNLQILTVGSLTVMLNATLDIESGVLRVPQSDDEMAIVIREDVRRRLHEGPRIGRRQLLALCLSTSDSKPQFNASDLYPYIFSRDLPSLTSQFEACSGGQLQYEPIFGGTMDIVLPESNSHYRGNALAAVDQALNIVTSTVGEEILEFVDHVMFCFPPGILHVTAAAVTNHYRSVYNDVSCARLSVVMHELGHNLGLGHASDEGRRYGDRTGYMGVSERAYHGPQRCFNAYNHWKLGWFQDRVVKIEHLQTPRLIELESFVNYKSLEDGGGNDAVLINLRDTYFIQYNRAKDHNIGTGEYRNGVSVIQDLGGTTDLVAGLYSSPNQRRFEIEAFVLEQKLVIEVCHIIADLVVLSVGFEISVCDSYEAHGRESTLRTGRDSFQVPRPGTSTGTDSFQVPRPGTGTGTDSFQVNSRFERNSVQSWGSLREEGDSPTTHPGVGSSQNSTLRASLAGSPSPTTIPSAPPSTVTTKQGRGKNYLYETHNRGVYSSRQRLTIL